VNRTGHVYLGINIVMLSVALLRSVTTFYATILNSRFLRPLTDNQIELVKNFAASSRRYHRERAAANRSSAIARTADGYVGGAAGYQ
jgi:hypothetical protein